MSRDTRRISWIKAARRDFEDFPQGAQDEVMDALTVAAEGRKADIAKPLKGFGSGMFEVALAWRGDAYRAVDAVQIAEDVWVVHAFQKKIEDGHQDTQTRTRSDTPEASTLEGDAEMTENIETARGSGNVYRDFGRADADVRQLKAILAARIVGVLDDSGTSVRKAQTITGVAAADFSRIRNA